MLSRRLLRKKVMQTMFAGHLNSECSKEELYASLHENIDDLIRLYLTFLIYIVKIAEYSLIHSAKKTDLLKKGNNLSEIVKNRIIVYISESSTLNDAFTKYLTEDMVDPDIVRQLFISWSSTENFLRYCSKEDRSLEDDNDIIQELLISILPDNNALITKLEENLLNASEEAHMVSYILQSELKEFTGNNDVFTSKISSWNSDKEFADELFNSTIDNKMELMSLIDTKLKNWDLDRVAQMDIILMQMALAELLYFETIPVKVSINEYIDLSKQFSTPKSKEFINGILDNLMKELKDKGKINKVGRGLVEN